MGLVHVPEYSGIRRSYGIEPVYGECLPLGKRGKFFPNQGSCSFGVFRFYMLEAPRISPRMFISTISCISPCKNVNVTRLYLHRYGRR